MISLLYEIIIQLPSVERFIFVFDMMYWVVCYLNMSDVLQVSTNILRKYSGPVDFWISMLFALRSPTGSVHCLMNENSRRSILAMSKHSSQWVWYASVLYRL